MPDSLWDRSLRETLLATASASPTPGGGSIAPVSGAFGLALVVMALEVTRTRRATDELADSIARGRALIDRLAAFADLDAAAFQKYSEARALPKDSPEHRALRTAALQAALIDATTTPLAAADACLEALRFADSIAVLVEGSVQSDVLAGADLMFGALKAVLRNAAANLPAIRDSEAAQRLALRARETAAEAEQAYLKVEARGPGA